MNTPHSSMKYCGYLLKLALCIAALYVFEYHEQLLVPPWRTSIKFDIPLYGAKSANGDLAVVDRNQHRCIVFNSAGEVNMVLEVSQNGGNKPYLFDDIAFQKGRLLVLDTIVNETGAAYLGKRLMAFDLSGNYLETLVQMPDERPLVWQQLDVWQNEIYAMGIQNGTLIHAKLDQGKWVTQKRWETGDTDIWCGIWEPHTNGYGVCLRDGTLKGLLYGQTLEITTAPGQHIVSARVNSRGDFFSIEQNQSLLVTRSFTSPQRVLLKGVNGRISTCGEEIVFCQPFKQNFGVMNPYTQEVKTYSEARYPTAQLVRRIAVWSSTFFLLCSLLFFIARLLRNILGAMRRNAQFSEQNGDRPISVMSLYGGPTCILLAGFVCCLAVFSMAHYKDISENARKNIEKLASVIQQQSPITLGAHLGAINTPADYNSEHYRYCREYCRSLSVVDNDGAFAVSYALFRFLDNGDLMSVLIYDNRNFIGRILYAKELEKTPVAHCIDQARNGKIAAFDETTFSSLSGKTDYRMLVPIQDANHKTIGGLVLNYDKFRFLTVTFNYIASLSLDLGMIFFAAIFLIGEGKIAWAFVKEQLNKNTRGRQNCTTVESHRTFTFMLAIFASISDPFMAVLAMQLAKEQGFGTAQLLFLAGLPSTITSLTLALTELVTGIFAKKNPCRMLICGNVILALCWAGPLLMAVHSRCIYYLLGGAVFYGIGRAFLSAGASVLAAANVSIAPKFKHLVFKNAETEIGTALAFTGGAFISYRCGYATVFWVVIALAVINALFALFFVKSDLNNVATDKQSAGKDYLKIIRYCLTPRALLFNLLILFPIGMGWTLYDFLMPIFNEVHGYSVLVTGSMVSLASLAGSLIATFILAKHKFYGSIQSLFLCIFLFSTVLIVLAFKQDLLVFALVLLAISLCNCTIDTYRGNHFVIDSQAHGVAYSDIVGLFTVARRVGFASAPMLISAFLGKDFRAIGIAGGTCFLICLSLFCVAMFFLRGKRH